LLTLGSPLLGIVGNRTSCGRIKRISPGAPPKQPVNHYDDEGHDQEAVEGVRNQTAQDDANGGYVLSYVILSAAAER
jgi:hypothetical protein